MATPRTAADSPDGGSPADTAADAPAVVPGADGGATPWTALTAGWTQKQFTFAIHKPYDLAESDRHTFDAATNTHTFWTLRGDKPHQPPPNTHRRRAASCACRTTTLSGNHQFEADVYVVAGTRGACVMQVFGGVTNATSLMLVAHPDNGGTVKRYDGPVVIKAMAYDSWWHLNVIHEANASGIGKVKVYADGQLAGTFDDRGNATHYFKCRRVQQLGRPRREPLPQHQVLGEVALTAAAAPPSRFRWSRTSARSRRPPGRQHHPTGRPSSATRAGATLGRWGRRRRPAAGPNCSRARKAEPPNAM